METNRSIFVRNGYLINSLIEQLEIQISDSGDAARYQSTIHWSSRGTEVIHGRWQKIRRSQKEYRPFITREGKRLYIDKFIRG